MLLLRSYVLCVVLDYCVCVPSADGASKVPVHIFHLLGRAVYVCMTALNNGKIVSFHKSSSRISLEKLRRCCQLPFTIKRCSTYASILNTALRSTKVRTFAQQISCNHFSNLKLVNIELKFVQQLF